VLDNWFRADRRIRELCDDMRKRRTRGHRGCRAEHLLDGDLDACPDHARDPLNRLHNTGQLTGSHLRKDWTMTPDALLDNIAADLMSRGATTGAMFGKRALKAHGKAFACLKGGSLAFRLGDGTPAHTEALAVPGAELFDPSGRQHPFKDWVSIPDTHAQLWPRFAETALDELAR
jgi:hypothetical protein